MPVSRFSPLPSPAKYCWTGLDWTGPLHAFPSCNSRGRRKAWKEGKGSRRIQKFLIEKSAAPCYPAEANRFMVDDHGKLWATRHGKQKNDKGAGASERPRAVRTADTYLTCTQKSARLTVVMPAIRNCNREWQHGNVEQFCTWDGRDKYLRATAQASPVGENARDGSSARSARTQSIGTARIPSMGWYALGRSRVDRG